MVSSLSLGSAIYFASVARAYSLVSNYDSTNWFQSFNFETVSLFRFEI